ncbi:aldehyde dehydrogenase family 2 member C4-like protein [Tanacetum coccineum]
MSKLAGVPDGVINVVNGFEKLLVTFTGSTEVGRTVMQAAALSNLKPMSLELGGKSPLTVFDDADVDKAVKFAILGNLNNKGEMCIAGSRVFVQEGIHDVFVKKVEGAVKAWATGDPFDLAATRHGPQNNKQQYEKVLSCIDHGKKEGATLVTGGKPFAKKGYYIEPTLFTNVTDNMTIAKEEIFGPIISVLKFKTVEEVIKRANATKYGLASGLFTKNIDVANTVSRSIRAEAEPIGWLAGAQPPPTGPTTPASGLVFGQRLCKRFDLALANGINMSLRLSRDKYVLQRLILVTFCQITFETIDPASEEVLATVAEGRKENVDLAVKAAREAFDNGPWPRLSGEARRKILLKFADLIEENADEIATLEVIDTGKPFQIARYFENSWPSKTFRYFAGAADKIRGATLKMSSDFQAYTLREPIGVVGHIIPWNAPAFMK